MGLNYILQCFSILAITPFILPTMSIAPEKTFRVMLLPLVLLANNDCEIDRTSSSSNSNRVNHHD